MSIHGIAIRGTTALCWLLPMALALNSEIDGWIPSAFANSSLAWLSLHNTSSAAAEVPSGRAFQDSRADTSFDYGDYKAVPIFDTDSSPPGSFQTIIRTPPGPTSFASSGPQPSGLTGASVLQSFSHQQYPPSSGYHYPVPQYKPPSSQYLPPAPPQLHESPPEEYYPHIQPLVNGTSGQLQLNSASRLFVQPGKCSNSIEVGRTRDVEVRTALKYGSNAQKGICVLMLYTPSQFNKLAISLQAVQGTTNFIPTGTWLETNVKVYALLFGDILPIFTK